MLIGRNLELRLVQPTSNARTTVSPKKVKERNIVYMVGINTCQGQHIDCQLVHVLS